eukprot:8166606-Pyramimonas_sp.AAC.1
MGSEDRAASPMQRRRGSVWSRSSPRRPHLLRPNLRGRHGSLPGLPHQGAICAQPGALQARLGGPSAPPRRLASSVG